MPSCAPIANRRNFAGYRGSRQCVADLGQIADHFNAEVDRLRSLGLWPLGNHEDIIRAAEALISHFATAGTEDQSLLRNR